MKPDKSKNPVWTGKMNFEFRVAKVKEELNKEPCALEKVKEYIENCVKEYEIDCDVLCIHPSQINYDDIFEQHGINKKNHIIWVQFANTGHVAVVGAGTDVGYGENSKTLEIIRNGSKNVGWATDMEAIIIPVRGLDYVSEGKKNVNNLLRCRNGVEQLIGNYLIDCQVPILNWYSHVNYADDYWDKCKSRAFDINS